MIVHLRNFSVDSNRTSQSCLSKGAVKALSALAFANRHKGDSIPASEHEDVSFMYQFHLKSNMYLSFGRFVAQRHDVSPSRRDEDGFFCSELSEVII